MHASALKCVQKLYLDLNSYLIQYEGQGNKSYSLAYKTYIQKV